MAHNSYRIFALSMIMTSFVCGIIGLFFVYRFKSFSKSRQGSTQFLIVRKPKLIILYCSWSLFMLLVSSPCNLFYHILGDSIFWIWFLEFIQDLCITFMLVIIAARCWLLYYDRLHSISVVDKTWKGAISNDQQDFWLRHRKTWGDYGFITCIGIIVVTTTCVVLSATSIFALKHGVLVLVPITTFIFVVLPSCSLIFFIVCSKKLKKLSLYDDFQIVEEIQYLSLSTILVIAANLMSITGINELRVFVHTGDILFAIITTYIQTGWTLKQLRQQTKLLLHKKRILKAPKRNTPHVSMSETLKNKEGFEMFMRHCQRELNVEGLLFIVEVAQFKAKLHENIRNVEQIIKGTKEAEMTMTLQTGTNPTELSINSISRASASKDSSKRESSYSGSGSNRSTFHSDHVPLPGLQQIVSHTASIRNRHAMDDFSDLVLERQWMPISQQIFKPKKRSNSDFVRISNELKLAVTHTDSVEAESITNDIRLELEKEEIMALQAEDDRMYYHAQLLFLKYIDSESEFTINVSYSARKDLLLFFSKTKEKALDAVLNMNRIIPNKAVITKADQLIKSLVVKEFLYLIFDSSLSETWKLLSSDSYLRFMQSEAYIHLTALIQKQKKKSVSK